MVNRTGHIPSQIGHTTPQQMALIRCKYQPRVCIMHDSDGVIITFMHVRLLSCTRAHIPIPAPAPVEHTAL